MSGKAAANGAEMAQIYANLPGSFTFVKDRYLLKNIELFRTNLLAWKAAGLPTET
jgi:hypothetical protein